MKGSQFYQRLVCKDAGIEGWEQHLRGAILAINEGLPSPSNMTFQHVELLLEGSISRDDKNFEKYMKDVSTEDEKLKLESFLSTVDSTFTNRSEVDATVRVFTVLLIFAMNCPQLQCETQPTINDHPVFTDFMLLSKRGNAVNADEKMCLIEVKRSDIVCSMRKESNVVAQGLREAHIMFASRPKLMSLLLLLTNSSDWSFAQIERGAKGKIKVISTIHFNIDTYGMKISPVYSILKNYLQ